MKSFKPQLAIDATDHLETIQYPKIFSYKLDGIRMISHPELGMVSRRLKQIPNRQLREKFKHILDWCKNTNHILDGEIYSHYRTFQEITRACMTKDFTDPFTVKKLMKEMDMKHDIQYNLYVSELLKDMEFHCFDALSVMDKDESFNVRYQRIPSLGGLIKVEQSIVNNADEVMERFDIALQDDYEGLMLRDPDSQYKFGRSTLKEEIILKVKPFETFDSEIIGVVQATKVDPNAEKTINELGRSVTSKKKGDRIPIEMAADFEVMFREHKVKPQIALPEIERVEIWKNKDDYIGKIIEWKGLMVGAKDKPRHPTFVRFREDCD